ncbi:hypothetical protein OF117_00545 [Geodermatophilus sp. YIM 151500]|uniref:hypothetical protein n=1 Tax=Geodermatophilus sp. YIM 151500 TaxID=2984531 RepID=UPI0021E3C9A1|nr:hypothetical protein [Geodermatophilus sp. YIM 151500]MCV2487835.1 hypothetical protein [Geodermatophilus sp. YIM 151500]
MPRAGDRPLLTAVVDTRGGGVRATGHLTVQGADLLRGTVETLRRLGHRRIVLDLAGVGGTDPDGVAALDALRSAPAGAVGDLVVRSAPDRPGHPCPR